MFAARSAFTVAAVALGALNSHCTSSAAATAPDARPSMDAELGAAVRAALADAAGRGAPGAPAPKVTSAERVTWSDGSLGCPQPGMMYTQALVPGYRIRVVAGSAAFDYHASSKGAPVLCPQDRSRDPVKDGGRA